MLMTAWKWLAAPWVYGVVSIPMTAIASIARPLQPAYVLIASVLFFIYVPLAWGFLGVVAVLNVIDLVTPETRPPYRSFADKLASLTLPLGWVGGCLLALAYLPSFNGVLRWFAAATIGYYVGTVFTCYVDLVATGGESDLDRLLKTHESDRQQRQAVPPRSNIGVQDLRGTTVISRLFGGGRQLSQDDRTKALDYHERSLGVLVLQDREADLYNRALMVHMNTVLDDPESQAVMVQASKRLSLAGKELVRRHSALSIPEIDLVGRDYMAWHGMYMAYSEWADAQHDVYVAIAAGRRAVVLEFSS